MAHTSRYLPDLPRMPMPPLAQSCQKLMDWAAPLLTEAELRQMKAVIAGFLQPGGEGEVLQQALQDWAEQQALTNWSAPAWQALYLASRQPLVVHSNVFYYLDSPLDTAQYSPAQIAAALTVATAAFMRKIDNHRLEPDQQQGKPLCMNQYRHLFAATRIPQPGVDQLKVSPASTHILVLRQGRMYRLEIFNAQGAIRPWLTIAAEIEHIRAESPRGDNLGLLTTLERENWAEQRTKLLEGSEHNQAAMKVIEDAAFVLCLDQNTPDTMTEVSRMLLHGDGQDRYFDKSLQLVVFDDGKTGINFEHTGMDGSILLRLIGELYDNMPDVVADRTMASIGRPNPVTFELTTSVRQTLRSAAAQFQRLVDNTQTRVLNFTRFGKSRIKQFGVSPDAFVQLALQLAQYRVYGHCDSVYEAVMTRAFADGRIDVLFTVTPESKRFIQLMADPNACPPSRAEALRLAAQQHVARARECRAGEGIYTHFLALKHRYQAAGRELGLDRLPELFTDRGYQALMHSVVCTSTTSAYGVKLAGYGPYVEDGYGIRYFKRDGSLCFNLTACAALQGKLGQIQGMIEQALLEMAALLQTDITQTTVSQSPVSQTPVR